MPDAQAVNPPPATASENSVPVHVLPVEVLMLDASAWREYRGQPGKATVNSNHIAVVADDAGVERICFVKLAPKLDKPTLLCEALGWVLAGHAGVRRSEFGAIILVNKARLAKSQPLTAECAAFHGDFIPAWCSEAIPGNSVLSHAKSPSKPGMKFVTEHKTFLNSIDARQFAAFDRWTGLRDRNMGNVIRHKAGGYASIDHETMLHDILWVSSDFNHNCLVKHAEKVLDSKRARAFKADMTRAASGHAGALASAQAELTALLNLLLPGAEAEHCATMNFLGARSQRGWLAKELGALNMAAKEDKQ
jgi:hypothetical protein